MFYVLSKILDIFLSPLTWGLLLIVYGAPLSRRALRRKRGRPLFCLAGLLVLFLFSIEPVGNGLFGHLEDLAVRTESSAKNYDCVILLGGVVDDGAMRKTGGEASFNDNVERLTRTFELLRENRARYVIISGGAADNTHNEYVEARVLAVTLERWGISRGRIIVEDHAKNTRENALFSAEIVRARHFEKVLVVTSAFHMRRASACFSRVGLTFDTLPVDYRTSGGSPFAGSYLPRASELERSTAALREIFGYYIYRARGFAD